MAGLLIASHGLADEKDELKQLIDVTSKVRASADVVAKAFVFQGDRLFYRDGSKLRRLEHKRTRVESAKTFQVERKSSLSAAGKAPPDDVDAPDPLDDVPLPKKVKGYAKYYDPRGSRGAAPPASVTHKDKMTVVTDQGDRGTCAAFASMSALESLYGGGEKLSAEYAYWLYQGKSSKEVCADPGTNFTDLADALRKEGVPNDAYWIYSGSTCPKANPPTLASEKATIRPRHVYYVDRQKPICGDKACDGSALYSAAVNDPHFIEAVIDSGYNIIGGFTLAWGSDFSDGEVTDVILDEAGAPIASTLGRCKAAKDCPRLGGVAQECNSAQCMLGAHAMLVMGYERTGNQKHGGGYIILKNSWGVLNKGGGYVKLSYDYVRAYANEGVILAGGAKLPDGSKCNDHAQCANFTALGAAGSACCKTDNIVEGVCTPLTKDHAGVFYCPAECVGRAGASVGTCPLKEDGDACRTSADCEGFKRAGAEGSACCGGTCAKTEKDWAGVYYCKEECVGRSGASPGTCPLADDGDACKTNADCDDFAGLGNKGSGCCGGKCQPLKKDWAGVYYCASECKGAAGASGGTCGDKRPLGGSCKAHADCADFNGLGKKGAACCGGTCEALKKDWAGVYYCADECVGAAGASKGTCPLKKKGDKCGGGADCAGSLSCCDGRCAKKLKDWAGVKYCPKECVGKMGGKRGTCD